MEITMTLTVTPEQAAAIAGLLAGSKPLNPPAPPLQSEPRQHLRSRLRSQLRSLWPYRLRQPFPLTLRCRYSRNRCRPAFPRRCVPTV